MSSEQSLNDMTMEQVKINLENAMIKSEMAVSVANAASKAAYQAQMEAKFSTLIVETFKIKLENMQKKQNQ